jgi:hypothetical protein
MPIPISLRLDDHGLSRSHVRRIAGSFTAQAFITTDLDDNQITAFHPGAMSLLAPQPGCRRAEGATLAIVAPDGRDGMLQHAGPCAAGVPFVFDPGQGLPMFSGDELMSFMRLADLRLFQRLRSQAALRPDRPVARTPRRRGRSADRHARWRGLTHPRQWSPPRDSLCAGRCRRRPDRLRRCLPLGPALRHCRRLGLGEDRPSGGGDGRDQDRASRRPEPSPEPE